MLNRKFFVSLLFFLLGLFAFALPALACNPCNEGAVECRDDGRKYKCLKCSVDGKCFYDGGRFVGYVTLDNACPQGGQKLVCPPGYDYCLPACDTSCLPRGFPYNGHGPQYWEDIGPCCTYSNNPVCSDDISVTISTTDTEVACASGVIDVYISNVQDAETVRFPVWTEANGQDDLVWYDATNQGGGVWKATVDLEDHAGTGTVYIDAYAGNCYSSDDVFCGRYSIEKVAEPSCPSALYRDIHCGATSQEVTFSWWAVNYPPLDAYVLRVNYFDNIPHEWYNAGTDRWVWVARDAYPPCGIHETFWGPLWRCTLSDLTLGDYLGWSVNAVDGCGNYQGNCTTEGDGFTCQNEAPTCSTITGPDEVISGSTASFTTAVSDSVDPVTVDWSAQCVNSSGDEVSTSGTFDPASQSFGSSLSDSTTSWTAPLASPDVLPLTCTIRANVSDTALTTSCTKSITVRSPVVSGRLFKTSSGAPCVGSGGNLLFSNAPLFHLTYGNVVASTRSFPVDTSNGSYSAQVTPGSQLLSATLHNNDLNPPVDTRYDATCYDAIFADGSPISNVTFSGLGLRMNLPLSSDLTLNIGYVLNSVMDYGWFTSLDAPVYSGTGLSGMVVSSAPEYPGIDEAYMTSHYAFSPNEYNVTATEAPTNRTADGGYAQNTGERFHFNFNSVEDSGINFMDVQDLRDARDPGVIYAIGINEFERAINDPERPLLNYGSYFEGDGVVVVFIDGDPSRESVEFTQVLRAGSLSSWPNRRYLFVTNLPVVFSPDIGQPEADADDDTWALPDGSADIEASIFTSSSISFPTRISPDDADNPDVQDSTITIDGSLIAGGNINMSRDLNLWNSYPAVVVKYNPIYLTSLQRQLENNPDFQRLFLSLVSISWDIDE